MKKFLSFLLASIMLLSAFSMIGVSAQTDNATPYDFTPTVCENISESTFATSNTSESVSESTESNSTEPFESTTPETTDPKEPNPTDPVTPNYENLFIQYLKNEGVYWEDTVDGVNTPMYNFEDLGKIGKYELCYGNASIMITMYAIETIGEYTFNINHQNTPTKLGLYIISDNSVYPLSKAYSNNLINNTDMDKIVQIILHNQDTVDKSPFEFWTISKNGEEVPLPTVTTPTETTTKTYLYRDKDTVYTISGDYVYRVDENGNADIAEYIGKSKTPEIPKEIDGHSVTYIGAYAFQNKDIESIKIPEYITNIGGGAFEGCSKLTNAELPSKLIGIGASAFRGTSLTSIDIPDSVTKIFGYAFADSNISEVKIGKGIKSMASTAFPEKLDKLSCYIDTVAVYYADNAKEFLNLGYANDNTPLTREYSDKFITQIKDCLKENGFAKLSEYISPEYINKTNFITFYEENNEFSVFHINSMITQSGADFIDKYMFVSDNPFFCGYDNTCGYFVYKDETLYSISSAIKNGIVQSDRLAEIIPGTYEKAGGSGNTNPTVPTIPPQPKISETKASLKAGGTKTLKVTNGTVKSWKSSDKKVATVKNGKVTALTKGTATITATLTTGKKLTSKITVTSNPKLTKKGKKVETVKVAKGSTVKIKITGKAKGVDNIYNNTKYAKITSKKSADTIKIKGKKKGTSTLKITVNGKQLKLKVKVNKL